MKEIEQVLNVMTPKQARRYKLYLKGESMTEIAEKEAVSVGAISICIKNAGKRAKKRLNLLK